MWGYWNDILSLFTVEFHRGPLALTIFMTESEQIFLTKFWFRGTLNIILFHLSVFIKPHLWYSPIWIFHLVLCRLKRKKTDKQMNGYIHHWKLTKEYIHAVSNKNTVKVKLTRKLICRLILLNCRILLSWWISHKKGRLGEKGNLDYYSVCIWGHLGRLICNDLTM